MSACVRRTDAYLLQSTSVHAFGLGCFSLVSLKLAVPASEVLALSRFLRFREPSHFLPILTTVSCCMKMEILFHTTLATCLFIFGENREEALSSLYFSRGKRKHFLQMCRGRDAFKDSKDMSNQIDTAFSHISLLYADVFFNKSKGILVRKMRKCQMEK